MRYFRSKIKGWIIKPGEHGYIKANIIYKRDASGKMWGWCIRRPLDDEGPSNWIPLRFNDARKIYNKAEEISEKEAFIEIL